MLVGVFGKLRHQRLNLIRRLVLQDAYEAADPWNTPYSKSVVVGTLGNWIQNPWTSEEAHKMDNVRIFKVSDSEDALKQLNPRELTFYHHYEPPVLFSRHPWSRVIFYGQQTDAAYCYGGTEYNEVQQTMSTLSMNDYLQATLTKTGPIWDCKTIPRLCPWIFSRQHFGDKWFTFETLLTDRTYWPFWEEYQQLLFGVPCKPSCVRFVD